MVSSRLKPLTLVDHESWENMVQAASLMAVMLNQSVTQPNMDDGKQALDITHKSMHVYLPLELMT